MTLNKILKKKQHKKGAIIMKPEIEMALSAVKQILEKQTVTILDEEGDWWKAVIESDFESVAIEVVNFISLNFSVKK